MDLWFYAIPFFNAPGGTMCTLNNFISSNCWPQIPCTLQRCLTFFNTFLIEFFCTLCLSRSLEAFGASGWSPSKSEWRCIVSQPHTLCANFSRVACQLHSCFALDVRTATARRSRARLTVLDDLVRKRSIVRSQAPPHDRRVLIDARTIRHICFVRNRWMHSRVVCECVFV